MNTSTQFSFSAIIISLVLLLGCQQTKTPNTAPITGTTVLPTPPMTAQQVTFKAVPFDYQIPKAVSDICVDEPSDGQIACPTVNATLADVNPKWVEDAINLHITKDNNPLGIKFRRDLDYYANLQLKDGSNIGYMFDIAPKKERTHKNVAQFSISQYLYLGGAHGLPYLEYHPFDMTIKSEIELNDVFIDYYDDVYHFAQDAYFDYLASQDVITEEEIESYMNTWPFELSDNFYFGEEGIVLVYQPYELGSYAQGFIELEVPYSDIQEIMRTEYLP